MSEVVCFLCAAEGYVVSKGVKNYTLPNWTGTHPVPLCKDHAPKPKEKS